MCHVLTRPLNVVGRAGALRDGLGRARAAAGHADGGAPKAVGRAARDGLRHHAQGIQHTHSKFVVVHAPHLLCASTSSVPPSLSDSLPPPLPLCVPIIVHVPHNRLPAAPSPPPGPSRGAGAGAAGPAQRGLSGAAPHPGQTPLQVPRGRLTRPRRDRVHAACQTPAWSRPLIAWSRALLACRDAGPAGRGQGGAAAQRCGRSGGRRSAVCAPIVALEQG